VERLRASAIKSGLMMYVVLMALLTVDSVWGLVSHWIHYRQFRPSTKTWAGINLFAIVLLFVVYNSNLFPSDAAKTWGLTVIAVVRTVADYRFCWRFYFFKNLTESAPPNP